MIYLFIYFKYQGLEYNMDQIRNTKCVFW